LADEPLYLLTARCQVHFFKKELLYISGVAALNLVKSIIELTIACEFDWFDFFAQLFYGIKVVLKI
jgi:hypothetical protein